MTKPDGGPTAGNLKRRGYYIYVTEACNLRCSYCFVKDKMNHRHLSDNVAERVLAFIAGEAEHLEHIYVHFFGGEPLIRPQMVDHLSTELRASSKKCGFGLRLGVTTNGTLLTVANCEMLKRHDVGVQLSLDGSKQGNDVHRQLMGGSQRGLRPAGAFAQVQIPNYFTYFGKQRPNCRMTLTIHNLPYLSESIRELHMLGFRSFSVIPDADCGEWTPEHLSQYEVEMGKVFEYWSLHRDIGVNTIDQTIDRLTRKRSRDRLCQVGTTIVGITIDGDIYPCHDFAGRYAADTAERDKIVIGHVGRGYFPSLRDYYSVAVDESVKSGVGHDCAQCWAKWVCGRGCPYMNYAASGSIRVVNPTYCAMARINSSLALRWMSALEEFRFYNRAEEMARRNRDRSLPPNGGRPAHTAAGVYSPAPASMQQDSA